MVPLSVTAISKVVVVPLTVTPVRELSALRANGVPLPMVKVSLAVSAVSPPIVRVRVLISVPSKSLAVAPATWAIFTGLPVKLVL